MNAMCDRLVDTLAQLRHADRLANVGQLASGVAHELGTPLNVVMAHASLIDSEESTADEKRAGARRILGAAEKMTKIIRRSGPQKAQCDLRQLTAEALDLLRPIAAKSSVQLELEDGPTETTVHADAGQVQQVVTNLVMNAIHAMPKGGHVKVGIRAERAHPPTKPDAIRDGFCLTVEDEGPGILPDDLQHIFEPFFTTKDVGEGTGLGLPVSYGIVQDHGGWLTVETEVGEGTAFLVHLPREAPPADA
jgi:signal transduction histidine kinase